MIRGVVCGETSFVCSSANRFPLIGGGLPCLRVSSGKGLITASSLALVSLGIL